MSKAIILILLLWAAPLHAEESAPATFATIEEKDGIYYVEGEVRIAAPAALVWEVLTDYDNLENFVPDMISSEFLGLDEDGSLLIDQVGKARFLFFSRQARILLAAQEDVMTRITFSQKEGDFKLYEGSWELEPRGEMSILKFSLRSTPDFFASAFMFGGQLRKKAEEALESVATESYSRLANWEEGRTHADGTSDDSSGF